MGKTAEDTKAALKNDLNMLGAAVAAPEPQVKDRTAAKTLRLGTDCDYEKELRRLQVELVKFQEWVHHKALQVVVIFEGRDGAGKGGTIKRITDPLNPRICRIVALPAPTERGEIAVVFPALRLPPARCRRNRAAGSKLVQPRRSGAGDGFLHGAGVPGILAELPRI